MVKPPGPEQRDWSRASADYARHRAGFPPRFFDELVARGWAKAGQRALDVGTGAGTVALGLAERGLSVVGLDPAAGQIEAARRAALACGLEVELRVGRGERTGLDDGAVDLVTVGQAWHWLERDLAALEARRVLAPGGRLVIAHFDFLERPGSLGELSMALATGPAERDGPYRFSRSGLYPQWLDDLEDAGFVDIETFSFDVAVRYSHEAWRGRMRASAWVSTRLPPPAVTVYDAKLAEFLVARFPDPVSVPHRVFVVGAARAVLPDPGRRSPSDPPAEQERSGAS